MKILVHLNHGSDKSYLLTFENPMNLEKLRLILEDKDHDRMIRWLMMASSKSVEVKPKDRKKLEAQSDITIRQDVYLIQKLA